MRIAINGFGRIGRIFLRNIIGKQNITVVAINDLTGPKTLAHLFKYDSVHRGFNGTINFDEDNIYVNDQPVKILAQADPSLLPWKALGVDLVIESTGKFTSKQGAGYHLSAGAGQVIISAPVSDKIIPTVVLGVNDDKVDFRSPVLSNASCTTNNVAAMVRILDDNWGIVDGYITTVHSMTGDQSLHDTPHKDLGRARAASASIIPTTTGAAKAITTIFPHLEGHLGGAGIRVPVLNGSLTDFTCSLKRRPTVSSINAAFRQAAEGPMKKVLEYTEDPIVSTDILGNTHSCIFDAQLTSIVGGLVKVVGWYDNEMGYASRLADLVEKNKQPVMIRFIELADVLPLRNDVLRNGKLSLPECVFPSDKLPGIFHLGYYLAGKLVCVASFHPQSYSEFTGDGYQLRGMATAEKFRGKGFGNRLLNFAIVYLRGQKAGYIWCNARKKAVRFYLNTGFEIVSPEFEVHGIGPHHAMYLRLM